MEQATQQVYFFNKHECYGDNAYHATGETHFRTQKHVLDYLDAELGRRTRYQTPITSEKYDGDWYYYTDKGECIVLSRHHADTLLKHLNGE